MEVLSSVGESLKCKECSFSCDKSTVFLSHFRSHQETGSVNNGSQPTTSSAYKTLCAICKSAFDDLELLKNHYIKDHHYQEVKPEISSQPEVPTPETSKVSEITSLNLNALKQRLTTGFVHRCTRWKCKFKFPTTEQRDLHTASHTEDSADPQQPFQCSLCPAKTLFKKWLDCCTHMWKSHNVDVGLLKCPLCNFRCQIAAKVFRHLQVHRQVTFQCELCKKRFLKEEEFKIHVESHELKARWYNEKTCSTCQHTFANSKTLSKHIKQVHNKIKPFICSICGYSAARKSTFQIHQRQHTGERPLKCKTENCDFRASDPSVLAKHMKKHSDDDAGRSYKCPTCKYTTIQASALKNHVRAKHADVYDAKIKCDLCHFTSVNEKLLARHKLDHKSGLIKATTEDSSEASMDQPILKQPARPAAPPVEVSSDCFSTDSIAHDPGAYYTGGVTIPANPEDAQFPN